MSNIKPIDFNVVTIGDAKTNGTEHNLLPINHGWGAAWADKRIDLAKDWSASYTFTAGGGSGTSDGYTFTINGDKRGVEAIGDGGGNLGFFGYDSKIGITNSYAVLFDMWTTGPASLIGFANSNTDSIPQGDIQTTTQLSNNSYDIEVQYDASEEVLSVNIDGSVYRQRANLKEIIGNSALLGITAANGGGTMDMQISNFAI